MSLLSSAKNTGFNGEFRLSSSSADDDTESSRTAGAGVASLTTLGGAGAGGAGGATVSGTGAGSGSSAGAFFLPHAAGATSTATTRASGAILFSMRFLSSNITSPRPARQRVRASLGELPYVTAITRHRVNLEFAAPIRHEHQVTAIRRKRRALVAPFAVRQLADGPVVHVDDLDVEPRARPRLERDFIGLGRPRRTVGV